MIQLMQFDQTGVETGIMAAVAHLGNQISSLRAELDGARNGNAALKSELRDACSELADAQHDAKQQRAYACELESALQVRRTPDEYTRVATAAWARAVAQDEERP